jgi:DNA-binding MarR family transcriptional regulator
MSIACDRMDHYDVIMAKEAMKQSVKQPSDAVVDAWIALIRAQQVALLKIERAFREAKLPPHAWYDALWELDRAGAAGLRPFEIEQRMLIAQSNISRLIDRLEEKGYVERQPCEEDLRGQKIVITASGRDLRKRMWPVYGRAISDAVGRHMSEREATILAGLLTKLVDER